MPYKYADEMPYITMDEANQQHIIELQDRLYEAIASKSDQINMTKKYRHKYNTLKTSSALSAPILAIVNNVLCNGQFPLLHVTGDKQYMKYSDNSNMLTHMLYIAATNPVVYNDLLYAINNDTQLYKTGEYIVRIRGKSDMFKLFLYFNDDFILLNDRTLHVIEYDELDVDEKYKCIILADSDAELCDTLVKGVHNMLKESIRMSGIVD